MKVRKLGPGANNIYIVKLIYSVLIYYYITSGTTIPKPKNANLVLSLKHGEMQRGLEKALWSVTSCREAERFQTKVIDR
jgi:hypothetical protein